ncbi:hypothetical protein GCM10010327_14160 [Streptomyces nitrosporeus]|nr:hypothetical protein GCM10010327_14160 [Streptomyces nitrosporeus]
MTMKVYEVGRDGARRVVREEAEVAPLAEVEQSSRFPVCQCPRCLTEAPS